MSTSKLTQVDAQEMYEALQQVGEGWWRQVALATRVGAHKSLGMTRREFAQGIGQRMIDPRDAIIELHREGHSIMAIADVLGVSQERVGVVLADEGLAKVTPPRQKAIEAGTATPPKSRPHRGGEVPSAKPHRGGEDKASPTYVNDHVVNVLVRLRAISAAIKSATDVVQSGPALGESTDDLVAVVDWQLNALTILRAVFAGRSNMDAELAAILEEG